MIPDTTHERSVRSFPFYLVVALLGNSNAIVDVQFLSFMVAVFKRNKTKPDTREARTSSVQAFNTTRRSVPGEADRIAAKQ